MSESYVTTDGQSGSLSWNKTQIWGLRPDFYYCQIVADLLIWVCRLQLLLTLASIVILGSESRGTRDHILLSQIETSIFLASYDPKVTVEVFDPASGLLPASELFLITTLQGSCRKHSLSIVRKARVERRCMATEVIRLLLAYSLPRECVYRSVA
jgi:hypothetical protein